MEISNNKIKTSISKAYNEVNKLWKGMSVTSLSNNPSAKLAALATLVGLVVTGAIFYCYSKSKSSSEGAKDLKIASHQEDPLKIEDPSKNPDNIQNVENQLITQDTAAKIEIIVPKKEYNTIIEQINQEKKPISSYFSSAKEAIQCFSNASNAENIEYANFSGFKDFNNEMLEKLTDNCPNIKCLILNNTNIQGDALDHLNKIPNLTTLRLENCTLNASTFENLKFIQNLKLLDIRGVKDHRITLENSWNKADRLQNSWLQSDRPQEPDNAFLILKYLTPLKNLEILLTGSLKEQNLDALKDLKKLTKLDISYSSFLTNIDALKDLKNIKSLNMMNCKALLPNSLETLTDLTKLEEINISYCDQLDKNLLETHPNKDLKVTFVPLDQEKLIL